MLKRTLRSERGSALVELALVTPLLFLILVGAVELGRIAYFAIEVSDAARAGVAYGSMSSNTADATDMETAATAAAADVSNLTFPTPPDGTNTPCSCETINTTTGVTTMTPILVCGGQSSTAATQCAPSTVAGTTKIPVDYVELSTQAQVSTIFNYPGLPTSYTLNGFAKMRVIQN